MEKQYTLSLLSAMMKMKGYSQAKLAEKSGVTKHSLYRFLSGKTELGSYNFIKILKVLNIDIMENLENSLKSSSGSTKNKQIPTKEIQKIADTLDPITLKTLIDTIIHMGNVADKNNLNKELQQLVIYKNSINTNTQRGTKC